MTRTIFEGVIFSLRPFLAGHQQMSPVQMKMMEEKEFGFLYLEHEKTTLNENFHPKNMLRKFLFSETRYQPAHFFKFFDDEFLTFPRIFIKSFVVRATRIKLA